MILVSLCLAQMDFKGGSARELADLIQAKFHQPVAVMLTDNRSLPKLSIQTNNLEDFLRVFRRKYHLDVAAKGDLNLGFADEGWPRNVFLRYEGVERYSDKLPVDNKVKLSCIKDKVEIVDGSTRIMTLNELKIALAKGGYELKFNEFFGVCRFVLSCHKDDLESVCKVIGQAIGASVSIDSKAHVIEFDLDVKAMRRRVVKLMESLVDNLKHDELTDYNNSYYQFSSTLWANMKDSSIKNIYGSNDRHFTCKPGTPIYDAAMSRIPIFERFYSRSRQQYLLDWVKNIDRESALMLTPDKVGHAGCGYFVKGKGWVVF